MITDNDTPKVCSVNSGVPDADCAGFRVQVKQIYADISANQKRLGSEFEKVWADNTEELYEA